jgi:hypothetical protein
MPKKMFVFSSRLGGYASALFLFIAIFSCTNLLQTDPVDPNLDIKTITDISQLMTIGEGAMAKSDWTRALACYNRVITLNSRYSQARVNAVRAVLLRDDSEALKTFGILSGNPTNPFSGLAGILNSYTFFGTNGAIYLTQTYLQATNGSNWYKGECDQMVPTNSFTPLMNLLYVDLLELPGLLLDLRRDYKYNNTNHITNSGDLLIVDSTGTFTFNPTFSYLATKLNSIANDIANPSPTTRAYFLILDGQLQSLHDLIEDILTGLKTVNLTARLNQIDEIFARLQTIPGTSTLATVFAQMQTITSGLKVYVTNDTYATVINGHVFNSLHSNLNGSFAFVSNSGIASFTPSPWVTLSSSSVVANSNSLQGILKISYNFFTN